MWIFSWPTSHRLGMAATASRVCLLSLVRHLSRLQSRCCLGLQFSGSDVGLDFMDLPCMSTFSSFSNLSQSTQEINRLRSLAPWQNNQLTKSNEISKNHCWAELTGICTSSHQSYQAVPTDLALSGSGSWLSDLDVSEHAWMGGYIYMETWCSHAWIYHDRLIYVIDSFHFILGVGGIRRHALRITWLF